MAHENSTIRGARNRVILALAAVVTISAFVVVLIALGSEDATSVEDHSRVQGAIEAVELPDGTVPPVPTGDEFDVSFDEVAARKAAESAPSSAVDHAANAVDDVCADDAFDDLCRYANGEEIPPPTPSPEPTVAPTPTDAPKTVTASAQPSTGAPQPTATTTPPPVVDAPDVPATAGVPTDGAGAAGAQTSGSTATESVAQGPIDEEPAEGAAIDEVPAVEEVPAIDEVPAAGTTTSGEDTTSDTSSAAPEADVIYMQATQPTADNPNPPLIACWDNGYGSLECER